MIDVILFIIRFGVTLWLLCELLMHINILRHLHMSIYESKKASQCYREALAMSDMALDKLKEADLAIEKYQLAQARSFMQVAKFASKNRDRYSMLGNHHGDLANQYDCSSREAGRYSVFQYLLGKYTEVLNGDTRCDHDNG